MQGHPHAADGHPGAEPLAYPGQLPEGAQQAALVFVQDGGPEGADVGAGADQQDDHRDQALEVEESRHSVKKTKYNPNILHSQEV